jgi:hypothetical protein
MSIMDAELQERMRREAEGETRTPEQVREDNEWNAAIEAAAKAADEEAAEWRVVNNFTVAAGATRSARRIRALKREAKIPTPHGDMEGLWDIVRELKDRPCEHGNDCRPKATFMHPCLPCAARMEWEAK